MLWLYNTTLGQVEFDDEALSASEAGINEDIDEDALANMHGYLNVALSVLITAVMVHMMKEIQTVSLLQA